MKKTEIATKTPGFMVDEAKDSLGETLKLPEWFELDRSGIEAALQPLTLTPYEKVTL